MNDELLQLVGERVFHCLGFSPTDLLWQRLARVVPQEARRLGIHDVDEFLQRALRGDRTAQEAICRALTINETYFFREPKHFDALRQILPELARAQQPVRLLSAGCSSGEEAYSLAMTAHEVLEPLGIPFQVLGVDFDTEALERARSACYRQWSFRDQGMTRAQAHLEQRGDTWCVRTAIRQRVQFEHVNLIERTPTGPFAVIFCRNTLMYFKAEHRDQIVRRFVDALVPGGALFIGSAETLERPPAELERVSVAGAHFYRKRFPAAAKNGTQPTEPAKVLLVSRSPVTRVAIRQALRLLPHVELAGEVRSLQDAAGRLGNEPATVVLIDALESAETLDGLPDLQGWPVVVLAGPSARVPRGVVSLTIPEIVPGAVRQRLGDLAEALGTARVQAKRLSRPDAGNGRGTSSLVPRSGLSVARNGTGTLGELGRRPAERYLLIGSSTGGPAVVSELISRLPVGLGLGVLVVQHMPPNFTRSFAERLARVGAYAAREVEDGDQLVADTVLVAPGGRNVLVGRNGRLQVVPPEEQDLYVPNVNRAFISAARSGLAPRTLALILTGMGDDGAIGMAELAAAGAFTVAQRPEEAVVAGMIEAALQRGAVQKVLATADIPSEVVRWAQRGAIPARPRS